MDEVDIGTSFVEDLPVDGVEIGESFVEDEPVIDGWTGFTNKIRRLFGRPLITRRVCGVRFDPGIVVLPGKNRFVIPDSIIKAPQTPQPPSNPPTI